MLLTNSEMNAMFDEIDIYQNGNVSLDEFKSWWAGNARGYNTA